jgi:hypothetical protein
MGALIQLAELFFEPREIHCAHTHTHTHMFLSGLINALDNLINRLVLTARGRLLRDFSAAAHMVLMRGHWSFNCIFVYVHDF